MTKLLTVAEVAERLRTSRRTAYRLVKLMVRGEIGGRLGVSEIELERYIAARLRGRDEDANSRHPLAEVLIVEARSLEIAIAPCSNAVGFTYFVDGGELIKIGRSRENLGARLAALQSQCPMPLRIIALSRGVDVEYFVHARLRHHRAHGEWFEANAVRALLANLGPGCIRCALGALP